MACAHARRQAVFSCRRVGFAVDFSFSRRREAAKEGAASPPLVLLVPVRIPDPLIVSLRLVALVGAVAAVAVRAGCGLPVHDAGHIGDEAPEHDLRRYAIGLAQLDEFDRQFDCEFVFAFHDVLLRVIQPSTRALFAVTSQRRVAAGSRARSGVAQRSFTLDAASTALCSVANSGSLLHTSRVCLSLLGCS